MAREGSGSCCDSVAAEMELSAVGFVVEAGAVVEDDLVAEVAGVAVVAVVVVVVVVAAAGAAGADAVVAAERMVALTFSAVVPAVACTELEGELVGACTGTEEVQELVGA